LLHAGCSLTHLGVSHVDISLLLHALGLLLRLAASWLALFVGNLLMIVGSDSCWGRLCWRSGSTLETGNDAPQCISLGLQCKKSDR
jgi:hypothetical protein